MVIDDEALAAALRDATSDSAEVRRCAVDQLADLAGAEAIDALNALVSDADPGVRSEAIEALGMDHMASGGPALLSALNDVDWVVRASAAEVAGALAPDGAVRALEAAAPGEEYPQVLHYIATSLADLGSSSSVSVLGQVQDRLEYPFRGAFDLALFRFGDDAALDAFGQGLSQIEAEHNLQPMINYLNHLLAEQPDIFTPKQQRYLREAVVSAVDRFGDAGWLLGPLLDALTSGDPP